MTTLEVRALSVRIAGREILHNVALDVRSGGWLGIIGPNGAGKTTLLRAMAGLVPSSGEVRLDGEPAARLAPRERARRIAIVAQRPVLPGAMTVGDYVLLGRTPYISYFDTETTTDLDVVAHSLERLGIAPYADRPLGTLSGGEQQRVVLARAIAQRAPVLLLDEGTSALDIGSQQHALELVESLRQTEGLTVVTAMHDLTLAGQFAEEVALLGDGRIAAAGRPDVVLNEDLILEHYGAVVRVSHGPDGTVVSPVRRSARAEEARR